MAAPLSKLTALGLSILAGCGTTTTDVEGTTAAAYVQMGGDTYRVLELGLDSDTYRGLVEPFHAVERVVDLGPSTSGMRDVRIRIDAKAPEAIFEFLLTSWQTAPAARTAYHHTSFGVLLGGGGRAQAVGMLLPAVQKFNGVSLEEDGSMSIEISGDGTIDTIDGGIPQEAAGHPDRVAERARASRVVALRSGAPARRRLGHRRH